jgi:uncharacterized protein involved in cysteine biosynthesis
MGDVNFGGFAQLPSTSQLGLLLLAALLLLLLAFVPGFGIALAALLAALGLTRRK